MRSKTLFVPMQVEAWVVSEEVVRPSSDSKHERPTIFRWQPNYQSLEDYGSPIPDIGFDSKEFKFDEQSGVHLHWILPAGLRHGMQLKAQENMEFPLVPNRWLVVRYSGASDKREAAAWVIESDFEVEDTNGTPFPSQSTVGETTYLGRAIPLQEWKENAADKPLFLRADSSGDPMFAFYQPQCKNIFSFHDKLEGIDKDDHLSYFVTGWYSNSQQDPLNQWQKKYPNEDFKDFFRHHFHWDIKEDDAGDIQRTLCHGMKHQVQWDREKLPASEYEFDREKIKIAVGSTSLDAFVALATQVDDLKKISFSLWQAFSYGLLDKLNHADGAEEIADKVHQAGFGAKPGGIFWKIEAKESSKEDFDEFVSLTPELAQGLNELSKHQVRYEEQNRLLQAMQWDLYALWWKAGRVAAYEGGFGPEEDQVVTSEQLKQKLEVKRSENFITKVKEQQVRVDQLAQAVATASSGLEKMLKSAPTPLTLKSYPKSCFWQPNDPVVLITGIQSPWTETEDLDRCRRIEQLIVADEKIASFDDKFIQRLPADLQADIAGLWQEFLLLDPMAPIKVSTKGQRPMHIKPWSQPWLPLYLEWKINWYPIVYKAWEFKEHEYTLPKIPENYLRHSTTYEGRALLTPQTNFALKGQLKRLQTAGVELAEELKKIGQLDMLAQTLNGFSQQTVMRDIQPNRVPQKGEEIYESIAQQHETTPKPGDTLKKGAASLEFDRMRHGQFCFTYLRVVDRFGQVISIVSEQDGARGYYKNTAPYMSENLKPTKKQTVEKDSPDRFVQLPPRIVQSARIDFDWLSAGQEMKREKPLTFNTDENPICGWLLPNYLDGGLQVYSTEGTNLGEIRLIKNKKECCWQAAPQSKYKNFSVITDDYFYLGKMLESLGNNVTSYQAFSETVSQAFDTKAPYSAQSQYFSALIGRPLALVRARWQIELEQPPYKDQSWGKALDIKTEISFTQSFPVRIGNPNLDQDGVIGYFLGQEFNQFYSAHYKIETAASFVQPLEGNYPRLTPTFGIVEKEQIITTLVLDPFAKIHAHTDILPVFTTQLPARFFQEALKKMTVTFRMGPLLTPSYQETPEEKAVIRVSKPSGKVDWSWLEPQVDDTWKEISVENPDPIARLETTIECVEGFLQLKLPPVKSNSALMSRVSLSDDRALLLAEKELQWKKFVTTNREMGVVSFLHYKDLIVLARVSKRQLTSVTNEFKRAKIEYGAHTHFFKAKNPMPALSAETKTTTSSLLPTINFSIMTIRDQLPDRAGTLYQVDVPGDGTCWIYGPCFAAFLPLLNNRTAFHQEFKLWFGNNFDEGTIEQNRLALFKYDGTLNFIKEQNATYEVLINVNLREKLAKFMEETGTELESFVPAGSYAREVKDTRTAYKSGDHLQIEALSRLLKKPMIVYQETAGKLVIRSKHGQDYLTNALRLVFLPGKIHYHYLIEPAYVSQSLQRRQAPVSSST